MSLIKIILLSAYSLILLLTNSVSVHSEEEQLEVIDNKFFSKSQRPPSVFYHDTHNEEAEIDDCSVCHHVYDKKGCKICDESSEDQSCYECHTNNTKKDEINLRKTFHIACNTCHKREKKGPISCGHCHVNYKK